MTKQSARPLGILLLFAISQLSVKNCHLGSSDEAYIEMIK